MSGTPKQIEPNYDNRRHVWFPVMEKSFTIEVKCWKYGAEDTEWKWNLYAHIFESHPLFSDPQAATESLYLHGGCTLDEMKTIEPARGLRYDWQRITKVLTVGCDYSHYGDDCYFSCDPSEGVPGSIRGDVMALAEQLAGRKAA